MPADSFRYVLITPAYNEAANIGQTIEAVASQTHLPDRWVIVSDGSTDATDDIVKSYLKAHPWMELVRMAERDERHFAGKVFAFRAGYERMANLDYDVIGNLDADITFGEDHFEFLMEKFAQDSALGVAGTPFAEDGKTYDFRFSSVEHVSGACQMFRRRCFEEIGGYIPVKKGGIDVIAVLTARMKGWRTQTFTERTCQHHRKMGSAKHNPIAIRFKDGEKDYYLGNHPLWEVFRCMYQMGLRPWLIGGAALCAGYVCAFLRRTERPISNELMAFRRRDQMTRLRRVLTGRMGIDTSRSHAHVRKHPSSN